MRGPEKVTNNIVDKGKPEQKQESGKISRKTGRSEKVTKKELGKEGRPLETWPGLQVLGNMVTKARSWADNALKVKK